MVIRGEGWGKYIYEEIAQGGFGRDGTALYSDVVGITLICIYVKIHRTIHQDFFKKSSSLYDNLK